MNKAVIVNINNGYIKVNNSRHKTIFYMQELITNINSNKLLQKLYGKLKAVLENTLWLHRNIITSTNNDSDSKMT